MKNICCLLLILVSSFSVNASETTNYIGSTNLSNTQAANVNIIGPANLDNMTLNSASITGILQFKNLTVSSSANIIGPVSGISGKFGKLDVTGSLSLQDSEINSLKVIGEVNFENVNVKKDADILGEFVAEKSVLYNLTITAINIELSKTKVNNITIKENSSKPHLKSKQIFEIKNRSIVNGDITFESNSGKILISKDSEIKGKIIGAQVQNLE